MHGDRMLALAYKKLPLCSFLLLQIVRSQEIMEDEQPKIDDAVKDMPEVQAAIKEHEEAKKASKEDAKEKVSEKTSEKTSENEKNNE